MPIACVRGRGANSHQHVALTKRRSWNLGKMQHVGRPVRLPDDSSHAATPATSASARVKSQARAPAVRVSYARHPAVHQANSRTTAWVETEEWESTVSRAARAPVPASITGSH